MKCLFFWALSPHMSEIDMIPYNHQLSHNFMIYDVEKKNNWWCLCIHTQSHQMVYDCGYWTLCISIILTMLIQLFISKFLLNATNTIIMHRQLLSTIQFLFMSVLCYWFPHDRTGIHFCLEVIIVISMYHKN